MQNETPHAYIPHQVKRRAEESFVAFNIPRYTHFKDKVK
jgi:hypothetical protein